MIEKKGRKQNSVIGKALKTNGLAFVMSDIDWRWVKKHN